MTPRHNMCACRIELKSDQCGIETPPDKVDGNYVHCRGSNRTNVGLKRASMRAALPRGLRGSNRTNVGLKARLSLVR